MPVFKKEGKYGDLIISFEVEMPSKINPDQYIELAKVLNVDMTDHWWTVIEDANEPQLRDA